MKVKSINYLAYLLTYLFCACSASSDKSEIYEHIKLKNNSVAVFPPRTISPSLRSNKLATRPHRGQDENRAALTRCVAALTCRLNRLLTAQRARHYQALPGKQASPAVRRYKLLAHDGAQVRATQSGTTWYTSFISESK